MVTADEKKLANMVYKITKEPDLLIGICLWARQKSLVGEVIEYIENNGVQDAQELLAYIHNTSRVTRI